MLFINNPEKAMKWNPILEPIPMAPHDIIDSSFTCLLKAYAIRVDVSAYFVATWKHLIPTMDDFLKLEEKGNKVPMQKIFVLSARLLDSLFSPDALVVFPSTATAICHAIHSMCGTAGVHHYLLYFLILPNLLKILTGDCNSIENEMVFRGQSIGELSRKYYDLDKWWPLPDSSPDIHTPQSAIDIVWLVWRLYSGASLISEPLNTTLSNQDFFESSPCSDYSGIFDVKIRNQLHKLQRKFDSGVDLLLKMPLDIFSSLFLGSEKYEKLKSIDVNFESRRALQRRLFAVMGKPQHLANMLVASKAELGTLFVEIVLALEKSPTKNDSIDNLSRAITEYLVSSDEVVQHVESILLMKSDEAFTLEEEVNLENIIGILKDLPNVKSIQPHILFLYEQIYRNLKVALKQDEMLRRAQVKATVGRSSSENRDDISYCMEYDQHYGSKESGTVTVFEKVTDSWRKKSKATSMKVLKGGELVSSKDENLSIVAKADAFPSKLRFDTLGSDPINDTSLGGRKPISPKKPTVLNISKAFTTSSGLTFSSFVNPPSFLNPTESYQHKNDISSRKTQQDIDQEYMQSMRSHRAIPTKKFVNRRNMKTSSHQTSYQL